MVTPLMIQLLEKGASKTELAQVLAAILAEKWRKKGFEHHHHSHHHAE